VQVVQGIRRVQTWVTMRQVRYGIRRVQTCWVMVQVV